MSENYLWSTYGVADAGDDWNLAATPSYNGQTTAAFNADTFRILKDSKHPDEAFKVLTYLLGEGSKDLLTLYGGMPARPAEQDAFFETLQNQIGETASRSTRRRSTGTSPRKASTTPTSRTSSRTCRPTTSRSTC